jgi:outer membrane protein OmpA-like peptidoglycan-associated protein
MKPAILFGGDVSTYVLWAITRDGDVENLGEVLGGHGSDTLKFQTGKKDFAVIMTAEPYYLVLRPSEMVMFASGHSKQKNAPSKTFSFSNFARPAAHEKDSIATLNWDSKTPLLLLQARKTHALAGRHQAATYAGGLYSDAGAQLKKAEAQYKAHGGGNRLKDMAREAVQLSSEAIHVSVRKIASMELLAIIEERQAEMEALEERSEAAEMMVAVLMVNQIELETELSRERSALNAALDKIADIDLSAAGAVLTLPDILFQVDKANLKPEAEMTLAKLAGIMLAVHDCDAVITGYTDSTGKEKFNMDLSAKRAGSVLAFLSAEGVSEARMVAVGLGPQNPIADNSTAAGRSQNRRVEILFGL